MFVELPACARLGRVVAIRDWELTCERNPGKHGKSVESSS